MSVPATITAKQRNDIENNRDFEFLQSVIDVNTMYSLIKGKARFPTEPCEVYSRGVGATVMLSIGVERNTQDWYNEYMWLEYYVASIDRLREAGLIGVYKYEHPGMMDAHMLPTTKGYEWFEQKAPGKYKEIIDEIREKGLWPPREA